MFDSRSGISVRRSSGRVWRGHGLWRQGNAGDPPPVGLAILVPLLLSVALVALACGGDEPATETTTTAEAVEATTTTTVVETTTTTLTGFAAIAPEGFPTLELPTEAVLIVSDPPAGEVGSTVTAFYAHEADVMEQFPIWRQELKDAGFELGKNQAWTSGGGVDGYILIGSTADTAYDIVVLGGNVRVLENNPFYDLPAGSIPEGLEEGFALVLTANEAP
jgi:hypothetical protein